MAKPHQLTYTCKFLVPIRRVHFLVLQSWRPETCLQDQFVDMDPNQKIYRTRNHFLTCPSDDHGRARTQHPL